MKKQPRANKYQIEYAGDIELTAEEDALVEKMTKEAEADYETAPDDSAADSGQPVERGNARIAFRWSKHHLDLLKCAADHVGVPYQTYIKMVLYKQVLKDLKKFEASNKSSR